VPPESTLAPQAQTPAAWTVVIPYYNEKNFLPQTLQSLLKQSLASFRLVLVDNASTDGTREAIGAVCAALCARGVEVVHLAEGRPGQVHALQRGLAHAHTEFTAVCDADTRYPPQYLERAERLFRQGGARVAAVLACGVRAHPLSLAGRAARLKCTLMGMLLAKQCHTGGFAHAFRTEALRRSGGYDAEVWPYVLKDHELMHRISKLGVGRYDFAHWCHASSRRAVRSGVRWSLPQRLLYHLTPFAAKDWFFYTFLAKRFARRGLADVALRAQPWQAQAAPRISEL
jgi:glycosyltransferase involved in cell wall biosynthesis